ncbi:MAG: VanW family protein, partial [Oscillospiraceae bacterium]|nr:VanW family protein [Oscillospiraceae bacterium]
MGCLFKFGATIYPNVTVCGVDVGGMGRDVAVRAVESASDRSYGAQTLSITLPDRTLSIRPEESKVTVDADAAVADALRYGREGGPISSLVRYLQCKNTPYAVDVSGALRFDEDAIRELAGSVARDVESVKKQPTVKFDKEQEVITVVNGVSARHLDADALYDAIVNAYSEGNFTGARFDYEVDAFDPVDLTQLWKENCTRAVNASYDEETQTLTEETPGYGFDLEREQQRIAQAAEGETLTIELKELLPEVTVDTLEEKLFPDVLASYDSPHTAIAARTNNLIHACETIDGIILNPGEVFSFNKTVGERTEENGYRPAIVYSTGGKSEMELGGGVCQVASTIYLCTLLADLDVVQRAEHMYAPTYVPFGMDATVYWGSLDFRFRNSTASPLRIRASVSDGYVHIKLLGVKTSKETIKMTYETLATIPWEEVEKVDETKPADYREVTQTPYTGYKVQTYKNYYDENGELLRTEKCAFSSYRKRDKLIMVGKPEEEPIDPPTDPVDPETPVTPAEPTQPT